MSKLVTDDNSDSKISPRSPTSPETVKLSPYNPRNTILNKADIEKIFGRGDITLKPQSLDIYQEAFIHRSYVRKKLMSFTSRKGQGTVELLECPDGMVDLFEESNERLEFLGDSIVGSSVVSYLFRRFPDADEGFMTKLKTRLVKTNALATFARYLDLGKHMIISKHVEEKCGGRTNPRMLEDLFEAFIGAMYLDFCEMETPLQENLGLMYGPGYAVCESFIINIIESQIDFEDLIMNDENYKDILLRHFQHEFNITPQYVEVSQEGPPHSRVFTMGVLDSKGSIIGRGKEKSKKKAEQIASQQALIHLGVLSG